MTIEKKKRWKYKVGQLVYIESTKTFGIVTYRSIRAYGIYEYYVKFTEKSAIITSDYYNEEEVGSMVATYEKVTGVTQCPKLK